MTYRLIDETSEKTGVGDSVIERAIPAGLLGAVLAHHLAVSYRGVAVHARVEGQAIVGETPDSDPDLVKTVTLVRAEAE